MSFIIAPIISAVYANEELGQVTFTHTIHKPSRSMVRANEVWVELFINAKHFNVQLTVYYSKIKVSIQDSEEGIFKFKYDLYYDSWLIKDRKGSGFGILEHVRTLLKSPLPRWSEFDTRDFTINVNDLQCELEVCSCPIVKKATIEWFDLSGDRVIDLCLDYSNYELTSPFECFVALFWFRFPCEFTKSEPCEWIDRKHACFGCYLNECQRIWDTSYVDPFEHLLRI